MNKKAVIYAVLVGAMFIFFFYLGGGKNMSADALKRFIPLAAFLALSVFSIAVKDKNEDEAESTDQKNTIVLEEKDFEQTYSANTYIQNNSDEIEKYLNVFNPKFKADVFCDWAKNIVTTIAKNGAAFLSKVLDDDFDESKISALGGNSVIYMCYLHGYKITHDYEYMTVFMTISDSAGADDIDDIKNMPKYFVRFKRKSKYADMKDGGVFAVSCPNCGGNVVFKSLKAVNCPYCGHTVAFEENDWHLYDFEEIKIGMHFDNRAVQSVYTL